MIPCSLVSRYDPRQTGQYNGEHETSIFLYEIFKDEMTKKPGKDGDETVGARQHTKVLRPDVKGPGLFIRQIKALNKNFKLSSCTYSYIWRM